MKTWDHFEYKIAKYYLPALINDDVSGMDEPEIDALTTFELSAYLTAVDDGFTVGHWDADSDDDTNFARCDVSNLYADVTTVRLMVWKET